jgi:hypothetical protein
MAFRWRKNVRSRSGESQRRAGTATPATAASTSAWAAPPSMPDAPATARAAAGITWTSATRRSSDAPV